MKALAKWIAIAIGIALLVWAFSQADLRSMLAAIQKMGWLAPLLLLPYFFVYLIDCLAWRFSFPSNPPIPFRTLFQIRWAGESLNNIVPSAYIGGEALKVLMLQRYAVPATTATTSAVVSKTAQTVAQVLFIAIAALIFVKIAGHHPGLKTGMLVIGLSSILVVVALFWIQHRGLMSLLSHLARLIRLPIERLGAHRHKIEEVDRAILGFYRHHSDRFLASASCYFGGWMLDTVEIWLASHLLGLPINWWQALCIEAFTGVAKALGMWVPGSLGVQESSIVLLGRLAGLPDTLSFTYALLRRGRELVFVAIGWLIFYRLQFVLQLPSSVGKTQ